MRMRGSEKMGGALCDVGRCGVVWRNTMQTGTSVNIHLKLSGAQQLKFLEELVSMLHGNGDVSAEVDLAVDGVDQGESLDVTNDKEARGLGSEQTRDSDTQKALPDETFQHSNEESQNDITTRPPSSRMVFHNTASPLFSNFVFPHPPSSAPPADRPAPRFQRARRTRHCSVKVDPSLYLNEAELALVSTESPLLHSDRAPSWSVLRRSGEFEKGGSCHKTDYWLKESSGYFQQQWLETKDRACLQKRQEELKKQRQERRKREEEAAKARERAEAATKAYGSWLQRKRAELRKQNKAATLNATQQDKTIDKPRSSTQQRSLSRASSAPRRIRCQTSTVVPQPSTLKKKVSFEEWLQLKDSKRSKGSISETGQLPEDLQKVAREMRKMRLQQKEYSKKHVDSGIAKKNVHSTRTKKHTDSGMTKKHTDSGMTKKHVESGIPKTHHEKSPKHSPLKPSTALSNVV